MPFVAAPNIVEMQFRCTYDLQRTMNRIHINVLTVPTVAICQSLATAGAVWWTNNVTALTVATLGIREVYCKSLAVMNGPEASFSTGFPVVGTLGQSPLPSSTSIAASLRSGLTGRSARGRWFWQGLGETQVDGNVVTAGTITSIDAALTNLKSAITALGYTWAIVSFYSGGGPRVGGPVYFLVSDILFTDSVVDSQRKRLPGRGS